MGNDVVMVDLFGEEHPADEFDKKRTRDTGTPKESPIKRLRTRQRQLIDQGIHPITGCPLLEEDGKTCGVCAHRGYVQRSRNYPKCEFHITHGYGTDCLASFPACARFEESI